MIAAAGCLLMLFALGIALVNPGEDSERVTRDVDRDATIAFGLGVLCLVFAGARWFVRWAI